MQKVLPPYLRIFDSIFTHQKVRKGFTLVKLRSQHDIERGQTLEEAVAVETKYFQQNEHYR